MERTLAGMVMEVRLVNPSKALFAIAVTVFGMTVVLHPPISTLSDVLMMALQLLRLS